MRQNVTVRCALLCLASALATAAEVDYGKAVAEAVRAGKVADVNRLCTKWAAAEPGNEKPRIALGRTLLKAGMADRALEQFELAAEANPLSAVPRCEMGKLFLTQMKPGLAAKEFDAALRIDPACLSAMLGRARVDLLRGNAKSALAQARRVLGAHAGSAEAHRAVGDCLTVLGRPEEALAELRQAVVLDPHSADGLFGLAGACELTGQDEEAQEHWQRFLEVEPRGRRAEAVRQGWAILRSEQLPRTCRAHLVWSPDGKRIMFGYDNPRIIDLRSRKIIRVKSPAGELVAPDWAPDGKRIVGYRREGDRRPVLVYDLQPDGTLRAVSPDPLASAATGRFSPDGTKLLVSGERQGVKPGSQIRVIDLDTGEAEVILWQNRTYPEAYWASWAPDSNTVVFHTFHWQHHRTNRAVFMMSLDAPEAAQQLTRNDACNIHPKVSPDGLAVAYSGVGRDSTVRLVRTDGGAPPMVLSKGQVPGWAPDGRRLAYDTSAGIVIAHLGGLCRRPVTVATTRQDRTLSVVLASHAGDVQRVSLRWEAFDGQSLRIGHGRAEDGPLDVKPKEKAEWTVELEPAVAEKAQTIKITALSQDGRGAVKLVDWQE